MVVKCFVIRIYYYVWKFFFSSRRRHTRLQGDWSSDVCSSDLDRLLATAPSGDGLQLSLYGLLGVLASGVEGFEVNVLGLAFGIDPFSPALRLPLVGRFGAARSEERRVGKECGSRWWALEYKKM